jgi:hypothetical protein
MTDPPSCFLDDVIALSKYFGGRNDLCDTLVAAALSIGATNIDSISFCSPKRVDKILDYLSNPNNTVSVGVAKV